MKKAFKETWGGETSMPSCFYMRLLFKTLPGNITNWCVTGCPWPNTRRHQKCPEDHQQRLTEERQPSPCCYPASAAKPPDSRAHATIKNFIFNELFMSCFKKKLSKGSICNFNYTALCCINIATFEHVATACFAVKCSQMNVMAAFYSSWSASCHLEISTLKAKATYTKS